MTSYIGIDPGKDGGVAVVRDGRLSLICITPTLSEPGEKRQYDITGMKRILLSVRTAEESIHAVIEKQGAFPGQGVSSMFSLGTGYGLWLGLLAGLNIPYTIVTPQKWKKEVLAGTPGEGKARSITVAQRLFPQEDFRKSERARKPHDGIAEAALIAWWGSRNA